MPDYYCQSSSFLKIPPEKLDKAKRILDILETQAKDELCYPGYAYEIEKDGVWIYSEKEFNPHDAERAIRRLVDELELDEPFVCLWSYSCSKMKVDEFGGGAFVVKRGYKTFWIDAYNAAKEAIEKNLLEEV
jgi:hypothetical protein